MKNYLIILKNKKKFLVALILFVVIACGQLTKEKKQTEALWKGEEQKFKSADREEDLPVLNEGDHLRIGFSQNTLPVDFHQPIPCNKHRHARH